MKVAIMQPYFFPYIGYFQLIQSADRFILLDDVQYIRHGWINRNRILKPGDGLQYIIMPLATHSRETLIKDLHPADADKNKDKVLRQIEHYKKTAPYYSTVRAFLGDCFAKHHDTIAEMNGYYLKAVCEYIGIDFKVEISSTMDFNYTGVKDAGEWSLRMCEQLQATKYINPIGGMELFDSNKFEQSNIRLEFLQPSLNEYRQRRSQFEPGLSIIDVMMFNEPEAVKNLVNEYQVYETSGGVF